MNKPTKGRSRPIKGRSGPIKGHGRPTRGGEGVGRKLGECESWGLLRGARQGNAVAASRLMRHYHEYLLRIANREFPRRLRNRVAPSDMVQDTLVRLQHSLRAFSGRSEPEIRMWLRRTLLNNIESTRRHHSSLKREIARDRCLHDMESLLTETTPSDDALRNDADGVLARILRELPPVHRQVLYYRHAEKLSFPQIGQRINRSADATRMLWSRAIRTLAAQAQDLPDLDIVGFWKGLSRDVLGTQGTRANG